MYKEIRLRLTKQQYRELQWLKKYCKRESWKDTSFLVWLIHKLYNDTQAKLLNETLGERK